MTEGDKLQAGHVASVKIFGRSESARGYAIRDFLHLGDVPFEWVELMSEEQARGIGADGLNDRRLPLCLFSRWHSNGVS